MDIELGTIIATRTFELGTDKIVVLIGIPQKFPDGPDYYCPYQINGIGSEKVRYAGGVDSIQALQLCLNLISYDLDYYQHEVDYEITWEAGQEKGDLGFPHLINFDEEAP